MTRKRRFVLALNRSKRVGNDAKIIQWNNKIANIAKKNNCETVIIAKGKGSEVIYKAVGNHIKIEAPEQVPMPEIISQIENLLADYENASKIKKSGHKFKMRHKRKKYMCTYNRLSGISLPQMNNSGDGTGGRRGIMHIFPQICTNSRSALLNAYVNETVNNQVLTDEQWAILIRFFDSKLQSLEQGSEAYSACSRMGQVAKKKDARALKETMKSAGRTVFKIILGTGVSTAEKQMLALVLKL